MQPFPDLLHTSHHIVKQCITNGGSGHCVEYAYDVPSHC